MAKDTNSHSVLLEHICCFVDFKLSDKISSDNAVWTSPAASVSVAALLATPVQWYSGTDPNGSSLPTDACCLLQSSASDAQPINTWVYTNQHNENMCEHENKVILKEC